MASTQNLSALVQRVQHDIITSTTAAGTGHPTSSLSAVQIMTSIFFGGYFSADLNNPDNPGNDRLIFSKGHAAPLLYALYAAAGKISKEELSKLRTFDSKLEGHPAMRWEYTEAATGSLGQGLGIGVGMALHSKMHSIDNTIWALMGDSEMSEGSIWEAMNSAAYYKLDNLVGIVDMNRLGQRGETMWGHDPHNLAQRAEAFGWEVFIIQEGNSVDACLATLDALTSSQLGKPKMIIAKTLKGYGVSFVANQDGFHGKAFSADKAQQALTDIGTADLDLIGEVSAVISSAKLQNPTSEPVQFSDYPLGQKVATRRAYGDALMALGAAQSNVVALDAEMNNSTFSNQFAAGFPDRYFEMFIAEQNMVSVATGLAARGAVPFISTFAAFLTRAFDQIRMGQYSQANLKIMGSHAGVSIGADGSSQMAVEDIGMMRSILDSVVLYPSDAVSTQQLVTRMAEHTGISYLRATRAETPVLYTSSDQFTIGGSKVVIDAAQPVATVMAAGITLHEAIKAADQLKQNGIQIRVVDMYSIKPIDIQAIRQASQDSAAIIAVEDHYREGGLYEAICSTATATVPVHSLAVTKMSRSGTTAELLRLMEIDAQAIVEKVMTLR